MVHLDGLRKQFGAQVLFESLSWLLPRGARVGLVGPNGAGKTTLLRILAGEEGIDGGAIRRPSDLHIGYLPQEVETVRPGTVLGTVLEGAGEVTQLEREVAALEERLAATAPGDPDLPELTALYGDARHRYEVLGGDRVEARARAILTGLGVDPARFGESLTRLSGGWRMRVVLARLLLGVPDLLLLDEPTNHLDLEAIGWLEGFLDTFPGAFVVVSHDRYFLNRTVKGVARLERGRLATYVGTYEDYLEAREAQERALEKAAREQAREIAKTERFIERFRYKATKAKQVQSRIRALEKVERIETEAQGKTVRFAFPAAPRSGDIVARLTGVAKSFGERRVFTGFDLLLKRGDRVALVGPNGAGKSTLLKLLDGRIAPDEGDVEIGAGVAIAYYAQHQLDALDPKATVLEQMEEVAEPGSRPRLRTILGSFLFSGEDVDKKVAVLSGGEKARLALARMLIRPSNLLLLDEPTNHLDLRSREVLEEALNEWEGTLVVVSHDRYFINRVATSIGETGGGRVEVRPGDYDSWAEWVRERETPAESGPAPAGTKAREREARRAEAEERNRRYRERRREEERLRPVEEAIAACEREIEDLTAAQADPAVYKDPSRARDVSRRKAEAEVRLASLYARWEDMLSGA